MNVMNGFVTSSTLAAAVDVNDLHPVTDVPVASLLPIVTMACFIALLILIVAIVIMSRPRRAKRVAAPRGSHNALAPVSQWKSRVHDIVERNGAGKLSREDAFVELAAVARTSRRRPAARSSVRRRCRRSRHVPQAPGR